MRIWPYTFVIDIETYRSRGTVPKDAPDPHFDMFLLDDDRADPDFVLRHHGVHPMDEHYRFGLEVEATSAESRRWADTQNAVLDALRQIESKVIRQLDAGGEVRALEDGHTQMAAIADRYLAVWEAVNVRLNEAVARGIPRAQWPTPQTWAQARRQREVYERNMRALGR